MWEALPSGSTAMGTCGFSFKKKKGQVISHSIAKHGNTRETSIVRSHLAQERRESRGSDGIENGETIVTVKM